MSDKYKHLEGAVPVNGDITPITRRPIDKINSTDWEEMSFESLANEYTKLQTRMSLVRSMDRPDLEKQMKMGLARLMRLIDEKRPDTDAVTLL